MTRLRLFFLLFELALVAVILILPQAALPDFTLHAGSAPVAVHSRLSYSPLQAAIAAVPGLQHPAQILEAGGQILDVSAHSAADSRLSLLCILVC